MTLTSGQIRLHQMMSHEKANLLNQSNLFHSQGHVAESDFKILNYCSHTWSLSDTIAVIPGPLQNQNSSHVWSLPESKLQVVDFSTADFFFYCRYFFCCRYFFYGRSTAADNFLRNSIELFCRSTQIGSRNGISLPHSNATCAMYDTLIQDTPCLKWLRGQEERLIFSKCWIQVQRYFLYVTLT